MSIANVRLRTTYAGGVAAITRLPRTAAEAKVLARQLNDQARRDHEAKTRAHADEARAIDEATRCARRSGRPAECAIDVAAIYAQRNRFSPATLDGEPVDVPPAGRPRSIAELAATFYGPHPVGGDAIIPTSSRGAR